MLIISIKLKIFGMEKVKKFLPLLTYLLPNVMTINFLARSENSPQFIALIGLNDQNK